MLTIEHCDEIHVHLPQQGTILSEAILAALRTNGDGVQTSARRKVSVGGVRKWADAPVPPALGELWPGEGGRYVGTMPARDGKPGYHLVLPDNGQNSKIAFGPYDNDVAGATDHCDGLANTRALLADAKEHPAARFAAAITADGHADFYLPAHNELMLMWICVPQLFEKAGWYWSSTQDSPSTAWVQDFEGGRSYVYGKGYEFRAVAVRRLEI